MVIGSAEVNPPNFRAKWTREHDLRIIKLLEDKHTIHEIADRLGRWPGEILIRMRTLDEGRKEFEERRRSLITFEWFYIPQPDWTNDEDRRYYAELEEGEQPSSEPVDLADKRVLGHGG